eukprot:Pgem_evm1s19633
METIAQYKGLMAILVYRVTNGSYITKPFRENNRIPTFSEIKYNTCTPSDLQYHDEHGIVNANPKL